MSLWILFESLQQRHGSRQDPSWEIAMSQIPLESFMVDGKEGINEGLVAYPAEMIQEVLNDPKVGASCEIEFRTGLAKAFDSGFRECAWAGAAGVNQRAIDVEQPEVMHGEEKSRCRVPRKAAPTTAGRFCQIRPSEPLQRPAHQQPDLLPPVELTRRHR